MGSCSSQPKRNAYSSARRGGKPAGRREDEERGGGTGPMLRVTSIAPRRSVYYTASEDERFKEVTEDLGATQCSLGIRPVSDGSAIGRFTWSNESIFPVRVNILLKTGERREVYSMPEKMLTLYLPKDVIEAFEYRQGVYCSEEKMDDICETGKAGRYSARIALVRMEDDGIELIARRSIGVGHTVTSHVREPSELRELHEIENSDEIEEETSHDPSTGLLRT
eukprot:TRINITY_DN1676_c0_g1_i1.p1 TRINITY_DN1676_c0_g1~~TRINITY_DN1676_c0_g1_i1.p1  ORF type:complete len:241 (+),score=56.16 TRINITY_DN1676_c0_g1_i1:55-723(+)